MQVATSLPYPNALPVVGQPGQNRVFVEVLGRRWIPRHQVRPEPGLGIERRQADQEAVEHGLVIREQERVPLLADVAAAADRGPVEDEEEHPEHGYGHVRHQVGRNRPKELEQPSSVWSKQPGLTLRSLYQTSMAASPMRRWRAFPSRDYTPQVRRSSYAPTRAVVGAQCEKAGGVYLKRPPPARVPRPRANSGLQLGSLQASERVALARRRCAVTRA